MLLNSTMSLQRPRNGWPEGGAKPREDEEAITLEAGKKELVKRLTNSSFLASKIGKREKRRLLPY